MENKFVPGSVPTLLYKNDSGEHEVYAPPIVPTSEDDVFGLNVKEVVKIGSYPDNVMLSVAEERDALCKEVCNERRKTLKLVTKWEGKFKKVKRLNEEHLRLNDMWRSRVAVLSKKYDDAISGSGSKPNSGP